MMTPGAVNVLAEQQVGGFDTAILEADSTEAMSKWLKDNGYSSDPELQSWLFPYVTHKWKITAFKISQDPKTKKLATTRPVRMSFATEKPFFPYREPERKEANNGEKKDDPATHEKRPRLLRVALAFDQPMSGKLGNAAWHADIRWSDQLRADQRSFLVDRTGVPDTSLPANVWLTVFDDRASPRPGKEEVYFEASPGRSPIRPRDHVRYVDQVLVPVDCAVIFFLGLIAEP